MNVKTIEEEIRLITKEDFVKIVVEEKVIQLKVSDVVTQNIDTLNQITETLDWTTEEW